MTTPHENTIGLLRAAAARQPADSVVNLDNVLRNGAARRARQAHRRTAGLTALGTACVVAAAVMTTAVLTGPDTARPADQDPSQVAAIEALALLAAPEPPTTRSLRSTMASRARMPRLTPIPQGSPRPVRGCSPMPKASATTPAPTPTARSALPCSWRLRCRPAAMT